MLQIISVTLVLMSALPRCVLLISVIYWMKPPCCFVVTLIYIMLWMNISTLPQPPLAISAFSRHVVDCGFASELQCIIFRESGCRGVGRAASWPWLRGAAAQETRQKCWELTGTRCLRLPAGGFSPWNKSVSGGSELPPDCCLLCTVCISESFVFGFLSLCQNNLIYR